MQLSYKIYEYRNGDLIKQTNKALSYLRIEYGLNKLPTCLVRLPDSWISRLTNRVEIEILDRDSDFKFLGLADKLEISKDGYVEIPLSHIAVELDYETLPMNYTSKNRTLYDLLTDSYITRDLWEYNLDNDARVSKIEYLFSQETKLSAIPLICSQTQNIHYRVSLKKGRAIEFGSFGADSGYVISKKQNSTPMTIKMLGAPITSNNFSDVINVIEVTASNIGNGAGQINLRDIYNGRVPATDGFAVERSTKPINTDSSETIDTTEQPIAQSNNKTNVAFILKDEESIVTENGNIYEGVLSLDDLYPIPNKDQAITDEDRLKMTQAIYDQGVRYLKSKRRSTTYTVTCGEMPTDINVGDRIRLKHTYNDGTNIDENLYILERKLQVEYDGTTTNELVLSDQLFYDGRNLGDGSNFMMYAVGQLVSKSNSAKRQRRASIVNLDGQQYTATGTISTPAVIYIPISQDMAYISRWGFKLALLTVASGLRISIDGIDLTDQLFGQYNNSPSSNSYAASLYPDISPNNIYDIVKAVAAYETQIGATTSILSQGVHKIVLSSASANFSVQYLSYLQYTAVSR